MPVPVFRYCLVLLLIPTLIWHGSICHAVTATAGLNISLSVPSSASLTLGNTAISFVSEDPAIQPAIPATENPVSVSARIRSRGTPSLTVLATDDLRQGSDIIPITAITWSADASPFINGTMNKSTAQPAASFPAGSGSYISSFRYFLANSPTYLPGTYSTTINYTLIAP